MWRGTLTIGKLEVDVKFYSAVTDRQTHFHLLHKRDRTRVEQRMVDPDTDRPVDSDRVQKAFEAEQGIFIPLSRDELDALEPAASRTINITRFVRRELIEPEFFDRPYFLGPDTETSTDYFALTKALARKNVAGIATWVMRGTAYAGALLAERECLTMIALRHADEVIPADALEPPPGATPEPKERELATKLIEALSGKLDLEVYHDSFQDRVRELIDAKRRGKRLPRSKRPSRSAPASSLADALKTSLQSVSTRRRS
jgi:DNA end-binding protein Ku